VGCVREIVRPDPRKWQEEEKGVGQAAGGGITDLVAAW
jgi:hypothetical protein